MEDEAKWNASSKTGGDRAATADNQRRAMERLQAELKEIAGQEAILLGENPGTADDLRPEPNFDPKTLQEKLSPYQVKGSAEGTKRE